MSEGKEANGGSRNWQGFCNLQGLRVGVARGMGKGWKLCTLKKPLPAVRVAGFLEGTKSEEIVILF